MSLIAEVQLADEPPWGMRQDATGVHGLSKLEGRGLARVMVTEERVGASGAPTLGDLRAALVRVYGTDFGAHDPASISRFTDMTRQAAAYRAGRVLLAGDAAHVHSPAGGQGLNLGVQDAVNLGWKLARVVRGASPPGLLDTYHAERHPVGARALRTTMALVALRRPDERSHALNELVIDLLALPAPRSRTAAMITGLDVRYDLGPGHALIGRRMPDLEVDTAEGRRRISSWLHRAEPLLVDLGGAAELDVEPPVRRIEARYDGPWELPSVGAVAAPAAVLVRPDGHVAWAGERGDPALRDALASWFPDARPR